jgi:hypothetical protein
MSSSSSSIAAGAGPSTRPTRHIFTLSVKDIRKMKLRNILRAAPRNRKVVTTRARGTCEGYWNSLRKGINAGQILGYSESDCKEFDASLETDDFTGHTMFITDGGHRFSWLTADASAIVFEDGNTLATLAVAHPQTYNELMETVVCISISTHPDQEFLKDFVGEEYREVNTTSLAMEGGELALGLPANHTRDEPEAVAKSLIAEHYLATPDKRGNHLLLELGLVSGAAKGTDHFHRKVTGEDDLLSVAKDPLNTTEVEIATATLCLWRDAEKELRGSLAHVPSVEVSALEEAVARARAVKDSADKSLQKEAALRLKTLEKELKDRKKVDEKFSTEKEKQKKILDHRTLDHGSVGPLLYGFREAVLADRARNDGLLTETNRAKETFHRWMTMSIVSDKTWSANRKDVASRYGEGNGPRYYKESRFKAGWTRMQTMLAV